MTTVEKVLDISELARRVDELEQMAADPDLWSDQERAQKVTSELSYIQADLRRCRALRQRSNDQLFELSGTKRGCGLCIATYNER